MREGEKFFKLKQTEISPGGYASYERVEPNAIEEFLERTRIILGRIVNEVDERTEGIREAIKARELTRLQRQELGKAVAAALALATPAGEEVAPMPTEIVAASNSAVNDSSTQETDSFIDVAESRLHSPETMTRFDAEVQEKIRWWQTNMSEYFNNSVTLASKPVVGHENLTREEYIRTALQFPDHPVWGNLPQATQNELRRLLPALAIQESGYHNGLISKDGAVGILQQIPDAIEHLSDYSIQEVQMSLEKQVEVAGNYFVNAYYVMFESDRWGIGDVAKQELQRRHSTDEFEREFLPRVLLNGYNVGPAGMAREIRDYFSVPEHMTNGLTGAELFHDIIEWSRTTKDQRGSSFGDDARNYVTKIYAAAALLDSQRNKRVNVTYNDL